MEFISSKTVAEERLSDISNRFEETEVENAELKKRLSETENRLRTVEEELAELKEPLPLSDEEWGHVSLLIGATPEEVRIW